MNPLLTARGIAVRRGDRLLLSGFDLALRPGQLVHLRGRNGIGKTSLLEVLAGLRRAEEGVVETRAALHWLSHRNALNGLLSPLENLRFWCGINSAGSASCAGALRKLGLARQQHRACAQLSAGQRRRAALARLLLTPRPLWLLDEPLSGLDAEGLESFAGLLREHLAGGGGAVVTSHQPLPLPVDVVIELDLSA